MIPRHCREVSIRKVSFPITRENILKAAAGKSAYVNTNYMLINNGDEWAIVKVLKAGGEGVFQKIQKLDIVTMPGDTAYVEKPEADVQDVSLMVKMAEDSGKDALVVKGKFEHVSFVYQEKAVPLVLFDVVPPDPPQDRGAYRGGPRHRENKETYQDCSAAP